MSISIKYRSVWVDGNGETQRSSWVGDQGLANSVRDQIAADNPGIQVDIQTSAGVLIYEAYPPAGVHIKLNN